MKRRNFLAAASVITAASIKSGLLLNEAMGMDGSAKSTPIIDTHQHLWDIERFPKGWSAPPLPGNFGPKQYLEAIKGLEVVKSVYLEVAVPADKRYEEALYAIEICKDKSNPTAVAVIAADPNMTDFKKYMTTFNGSPYIRGIRYFFQSGDEILREQVIKNIKALGEMNMSFEFSIPPAWLPQMSALTKRCPDVQFIVNHCGNADPRAFFKPEELFDKPDHDTDKWISDMKEIASGKNVACKISGLVTRAPGYSLTAENIAPAIDHCLDIFGPDRVMFASDWPVCLIGMEMRSWVNMVKKVVAGRPFKDQRKFFYNNAIKFYKI